MSSFVNRAIAATCLLVASELARAQAVHAAASAWVGFDRAGRLAYRATPAGDRILDFSTAGYRGGGVALPDSTPTLTVRPGGGDNDDSPAIQVAIDDVASRPAVDGHRGTVFLAPGTYRCVTPITIAASGVVLRGSGAGDGGSVLRLDGEPHLAISIAGAQPKPVPASAPTANVLDRYVPSGTSTLRVSSTEGLHVGDSIYVVRPVTPAWVKFMGMDDLVRRDAAQTWITGDTRAERTIAAIDGDRVTLDVPLTDSLDARHLDPPGATLVRIEPLPRIAEVGIESLRITAPPRSVEITDPNFSAVRINSAQDVWLRDVSADETVNSVAVGRQVRRATVQRVSIRHTTRTKGAAAPSDFSCDGSQVLFDRCAVTGSGLFYFSTGAKAVGPIVLLNCTFDGNGSIQPHQRWATGLLVDNCKVPTGNIELMNRGYLGSGHGWTIGWSVVWNSSAKSLLIQRPPGSMNWAIGCAGEQKLKARPGDAKGVDALPQGIVESPDVPVTPASLYVAQLIERLGPAAANVVGY